LVSTSFKELYDEAESGSVGGNVPAGPYDMIVTGTRVLETSNLIFLTLQVLNGPQQGKEIDVNLFIPHAESKRGARVFFVKKINGFIAYPDVKAAFQAADNAPDIKSGFEFIAGALVGKQVVAEVGLRTEGEYAGSNELISTKPMQSTIPTQNGQVIEGPSVMQSPAPAPVTAPAAAPGAEAPPF
jgi:hypothetical protein